MACNRCEDIHKAQRDGKTNQKCECDCHISYSTGTADLQCTCNQTGLTTGNFCPVHGNTFFLNTVFGDSSGASTINI